MILGKHSCVHKSIFSSRSDLKALNTKLQNYVTHVLEPLMTMSYYLGNEYPHGPMGTIWKLLFENAAHDSIGSCISDTANEDVIEGVPSRNGCLNGHYRKYPNKKASLNAILLTDFIISLQTEEENETVQIQ